MVLTLLWVVVSSSVYSGEIHGLASGWEW